MQLKGHNIVCTLPVRISERIGVFTQINSKLFFAIFPNLVDYAVSHTPSSDCEWRLELPYILRESQYSKIR